MKRLPVVLLAILTIATLTVAGCGQGAASSAPAQPSSAPTTAASAAQPTAASAQKVDWPQKGKTMSIIVPWPTGGGNDISARIMAPLLEKELGISVQVVNKPGAGSQTGITELVRSKPDGYTIGMTSLPATNITYLDPQLKAIYSRKDFMPLALENMDPLALAVKPDSPYKTVKDLIDAAKANPGKIPVGATGAGSASDLGVKELEKAAGVQFAVVQFNGGSDQPTALLGGHIQVGFDFTGTWGPEFRNGSLKSIGVMDSTRNKFIPDVPTLEEQGYKVYMTTARGYTAPAGTPKEVADILSGAIQKAVATDEHQTKMDQMGIVSKFMDSQQFSAYWDQVDAQIKPLIEQVRQ